MKAYIYWITFVAVNGGLLFGLNMAGISGAVNSIQDFFQLTDNGIGMVVSSLTIGCLLGALFTGALADRFGRKTIFLSVALLFLFFGLRVSAIRGDVDTLPCNGRIRGRSRIGCRPDVYFRGCTCLPTGDVGLV